MASTELSWHRWKDTGDREVCVDRYVWDRNETKPTCRLDPDKVQGPRLKGKERYEWGQQHYLLWLHFIHRPTLFRGLSCHRFPGPTLEMRTEVGSSQLLGGSNAVAHRTHQEKHHLRTANRVGHWTPPHREDQGQRRAFLAGMWSQLVS